MTPELFVLIGFTLSLGLGAFFLGRWWELSLHDGWFRTFGEAEPILDVDDFIAELGLGDER